MEKMATEQNQQLSRGVGAAGDRAGEQRITFGFTPEAAERLEELKGLIGARTNAEVVRKALQVLDWLVRKQRENYQLQLVKENSVKEVELVL